MEKSKKQKSKQPIEEIKYWLIEITLTSGEFLQFYVKALTQFDAYEKAEGYSLMAENELLKNKFKQFRLLT